MIIHFIQSKFLHFLCKLFLLNVQKCVVSNLSLFLLNFLDEKASNLKKPAKSINFVFQIIKSNMEKNAL